MTDQPISKVEVTGLEARYYDLLMNLITGGTCPFFHSAGGARYGHSTGW